MPSPCRIHASPYTGPSLTFPATRHRWERVWSDSFSRLLVSASGHIQGRASRQSQQVCRPCQATKFYASICKLIECCSSRYPVFRGRKSKPRRIFPPRLLLLAYYLVWNVRNSANSVELLIFVTNHGSGPI